MITLKNLILNEFFPIELPKFFSTKEVLPYIDNIFGWTPSLLNIGNNLGEKTQ